MNEPLNRKLRMALVGGAGQGFIGRIHAAAAIRDHRAELVAGALSSDPQKARNAAASFGIPPHRAYESFDALVKAESQVADEERIDFVSIATPNYLHFPMAKQALEADFNVVCDKPMTIDLANAEALVRLVQRKGAVFALSHNYTGYPMIRQARQMIRDGELGEIQAVRLNYIQGWLRGLKPGTTPARGAWKVDPVKIGPSETMGDIGVHAYQLVRYVTGLSPERVSATMTSYYPDRRLDNYGHALVQFENHALGMITVSQVTHGRLNDLSLEVDGTEASFSWRQEDPNQLHVRRFGQPMRTYDRNPLAEYTNESGRAACRLPAGHPEAFVEAFANVYRDCFDDMLARTQNRDYGGRDTVYPNVYDGVEGVFFVQQCLASSRDQGIWKPLHHELARRDQ